MPGGLKALGLGVWVCLSWASVGLALLAPSLHPPQALPPHRALLQSLLSVAVFLFLLCSPRVCLFGWFCFYVLFPTPAPFSLPSLS